MYIEDLMDRLACNGSYIFDSSLPIAQSDYEVISSMSDQIQRGNAYTEKQRALALKLVDKYGGYLTLALGMNVIMILQNPQFRNPVRVLSADKLISFKEDQNNNRTISVRFPYNTELVERIKKHKSGLPIFDADLIRWNSESRDWEFPLSELNVMFLASFISAGFTIDEELLHFYTQIQEIEMHIEDYVPMVVFENNRFSFRNVIGTIPQPISNNVIEVLLLARQYGITCWDDAIDEALHSIEPSIYSFLKNATNHPEIQPQDTYLDTIKDILTFSENVLFVIPGGSELEHLTYAHEYLKSIGYTNEQMTVMFRLDSSFGQMCNSYIKENKLNSPISGKIKFIFISGKIPKPLIESGKNFDAVIHFGTNSAHYTLKNYIKHHNNVISMNIPNNKNKELNFA